MALTSRPGVYGKDLSGVSGSAAGTDAAESPADTRSERRRMFRDPEGKMRSVESNGHEFQSPIVANGCNGRCRGRDPHDLRRVGCVAPADLPGALDPGQR